jgi:hypothetical protein
VRQSRTRAAKNHGLQGRPPQARSPDLGRPGCGRLEGTAPGRRRSPHFCAGHGLRPPEGGRSLVRRSLRQHDRVLAAIGHAAVSARPSIRGKLRQPSFHEHSPICPASPVDARTALVLRQTTTLHPQPMLASPIRRSEFGSSRISPAWGKRIAACLTETVCCQRSFGEGAPQSVRVLAKPPTRPTSVHAVNPWPRALPSFSKVPVARPVLISPTILPISP